MQKQDDVLCVQCGVTGAIKAVDGHIPGRTGIERGVFKCSACDGTYDQVWGVPFFGKYERSELLGLIEIAANIENRGNFGVTPSSVEQMEQLLTDYHHATDKASFLETVPGGLAPYVVSRYGEWIEVRTLSDGLDLRGKNVLDLGAGLGFDAHRLSLLGANVTALEFSPVLAEWGAEHFPNIRWVGGLADIMPFGKGSFDAIFCNAALHHMRDIPAVLRECLRVLKTEGTLITTCDSFRPSNVDFKSEAKIFEADTAVLMGVNERVPKFDEFAKTFERYQKHLAVEVFTHTLYNAPGIDGGTGILSELTAWDFKKDRDMLAARSGSLAFKVKVKIEPDLPLPRQNDPVLSPADFAESMKDQREALAVIAPLVPADFTNLPFPGKWDDKSKFELLNGWRLPQAKSRMRTAFRRGRWFLTRHRFQSSVLFEARLPSAATTSKTLSIYLNGRHTFNMVLTKEWIKMKIDVTSCEAGVPFIIECKLSGDGYDLLEHSFEVKRRRFGLKNFFSSSSTRLMGSAGI